MIAQIPLTIAEQFYNFQISVTDLESISHHYHYDEILGGYQGLSCIYFSSLTKRNLRTSMIKCYNFRKQSESKHIAYVWQYDKDSHWQFTLRQCFGKIISATGDNITRCAGIDDQTLLERVSIWSHVNRPITRSP